MNVRRLKVASAIAAVLAAAAGSTIACANGESTQPLPREGEAHWDCARVDVPMGEIVRCTSPGTQPTETVAVASGGIALRTIGVPTGPNPREADCGPDGAPVEDTPPDPPPPPPPPPPPEVYECAAGSGPDCPAAPPPVVPPAPGNESPGPDECPLVSGLPYCPPPPAPPPPPSVDAPPPVCPAMDIAPNAFCSAPLGKPENECAALGLTWAGAKDETGGSSVHASHAASAAIVKGGSGGGSCPGGQSSYRVYVGVKAGDSLQTGNGTDVSHVTYCGCPSSSAPPPPPPDHWSCSKDKETGARSCDSPPVCVPGSHPSSCGACVLDGESDSCASPLEGGCWVTGGGFVGSSDGNDNFGGNAKPMKDGTVQGHWNHVDHGTNSHAKGKPQYIHCAQVDRPGPGQPGGKKGFKINQVYFGGPAEWGSGANVSSGYWFDVVAEDHGEPGSQPHAKNKGRVDTYHLTIRKVSTGEVVYDVRGDLVGGNIQLHPPNAGHPGSPGQLPAWVQLEP